MWPAARATVLGYRGYIGRQQTYIPRFPMCVLRLRMYIRSLRTEPVVARS